MNYLNNMLEICLNIADYYDNKGDKDDDFLNDELTKELGLGYRALTNYLRKGVQEVISLQMNCHKACGSWRCPFCGQAYIYSTDEPKYCQKCGQAIKWD